VEVVKLWDKVTWCAKFNKNFLRKKVRLAPWMEEEVQNLLSQIGSQGTMNSKHMDSKHIKYVSFVGSKQSKWLWCGA
jgi:hypothetical protein